MKRMEKVLSIVTIAMMLIVTAGNLVYAFDPATVSGSYAQSIGSIGNTVVGIVRTVGTFAAVAILVVLGVKYMMGSAEEKAEYKKTMLPYIIGAVMVFAASQLAGVIYNMSTQAKWTT